MDIKSENIVAHPRKLWLGLVGVIALVSIIFNIYQSRQINLLENPRAFSEKQIARYIRDIGAVIALPSDETPTLATVSDPEELKSQPFFANAEVGDIVLVYENAKKAVLWRPSEKKLIEVSSVIAPAGGATTPAKH
jgi:hypothetical protein